MQRTVIILACIFSAAMLRINSFAQIIDPKAIGPGEQYPFVHYTPKDGLISNQIKNIYQDSKGRLYFTSVNGLSIYDGSRFMNYTSKNGLDLDIVNCIMEMDEDSIWIITNSGTINCLVKGKMKKLEIKGKPIVIDKLIKDDNNVLYAASEQGLYKFQQNEFVKLPFFDLSGKDKSRFLTFIASYGSYLLVQHDYSLLSGEKHMLYLYDKRTQKIVSEAEKIIIVDKAPDGRIWVSAEKNIMALDTSALNNGKLVLQDLPPIYDKIKNLGGYFISFDQGNNCWLGDQSSNLLKIEPNGRFTTFSTASGLSMSFINAIFLDKENVTWIATNNAGLNKLVQSNFSRTENPFGFSSFTYDLSYREDNDQLLLYSNKDSKLAVVKKEKVSILNIDNTNEIERITETPHGFFGTALNKIYKLNLKGNLLIPQVIFTDSTHHIYSSSLVDKNGNFIVCCNNNITAIINGRVICSRQLNHFADQPALDSKGNIWVVTRAGELTMFYPDQNDAVNYLKQKKVFSEELSGVSPRSIVIDKSDNIWIGTRNHGIHVFAVNNGALVNQFIITTATGLSDDFTKHLACDSKNNIWACSASGLDKLSIKNGVPVIENITKQNNIYQSVFKVVIDNNDIAWGLVSNGIIKVLPESKRTTDYSPTLMVTMVKTGKDTVFNQTSFNHKKNNFNFYFSATSFFDEKQILYSYRLNGGSNNQWSEPSNNSSVSFINLPPGDYRLEIKAIFPAGRYPEQIINYAFSISLAWWQTWWFKSVIGILGIGILVAGIRFYYRRSLEKEKAILEKQQAIEKERTRIATDMHDDLGAGLSRIKFLSQSLLNKKRDEIIKPELEKITAFSDEMSEKMGEIIWALNEKNDTLADLVAYTRSYAAEYLASHAIECEANTPMNLPETFITGEMRRNIFLSVKECLHNIVKHAGATKVYFSIELNHTMQIIIHDNGKGFYRNLQRSYGNGLQNIEKRMKEINGKVSFKNDKGTKVSLTIPISL
jgi:ligand-binding sensor domain-containing protein/two-component sensor histidine kinase